MQVNVINENNVEVSIDPPQTIIVEVDQGKQGRGITNISYQQEGEYYYLVVTYTDGTTEQLGPLIITGAAASLLGGTAGAIAYQTAPDNTGFIALGAQNQVLVAGPTAPQYTSSLTGLTVNNSAIGNTTPSTGAFTNLSASGAFSLTGDQVQISEGGTGQTTANAAFNALAPSQTGNSGKYLKTDGTNTSWDQLDISTADITGTLAVTNGGTGATNAADARTNLNAASQSTTIFAGTGLTGGGDLSANRTLNIANTTVTAGAYGSASDTLTATVNAQGQLTALAATPIAITNTQISGLGTMSTQNANSVSITGGSITGITDLAVADGGTGASNAADARTNLGAAASATTISAGTGLTGGGDLSANRTISIANTTVTAGAYGSASNTLTATVNAQGQLTALSATPIAIANTQVSGLGTMSTQNSNSVTITGGSITGITDLAIADGGTGASTAADARANLGLGSAAVLNAGVANGVATLDSGGTVPLSQLPASIQGGVSYQGSWDAATNTPTLTSSVGSKGYYYVVSVAGSTNLNGVTDWLPGDWAIFNGSVWQKIDNTDAVASVNGYTGVVVLSAADVGAPPTSRTISAGTGLTGGGDLSTNRTISIDNTTVSAGSYGSASSVGTFTVNGQGQLTAAASTPIAITNTQVSGLGTMSTQNANSVSITGGSITGITDLAVADGGTGASDAASARTNLGAAASGANSDITSLSGITGAIGTADYVAFDTTYTTTLAAGQLGWDGNNTLGLGMAGGNVVQKIGEDQFYYIKASSAITKGQVVMFTGSVGASGVVTGAPATGITDGSYIMGIAAETIALNGFGLVQFEGTLRGIDTSAFTDGAILWYNPAVTGGLTATQPSAPNVKVQMAAVINAGSGGSGSVLIRVTAGSVLGGTDSNVQFSTLANGNIIQYDSALGYWKNVAPTSVAVTTFSGGTTGLTPATATAGDVTLGGTLAIANGGTGQTTANAAFNALAPSQTGNAGKYLTTDGTNTSWANNSLGTVTSVDASGGTTGMSFTGGPITSSGTLTLTGTLAVANGGTGVTTSTGTGSVVLSTSPTLVTPALGTPTSGNFSTGTFTWPTFNQNTTGTASNVTGVVDIANGGTGQTTANAAFNALAPSQTGNSGKYLTTDGTNTSWAANPLGTVTSVDVSGGTTGLTTSGGPITSSGTITLAGTLNVANGGTGATAASGARTNLDVPGLADANTFTNTNVISVNSASDALRITQTGAGNALVIEDEANPDSTPFVINPGGNVISGYTVTVATQNYAGLPTTPSIQNHGTNASVSSNGLFNWATGAATAASLIFSKSISGTIGTRGALTVSGSTLGAMVFTGDDGTNFIPGAAIISAVDGTPGTNDMPGRLVFSTTADGAASPTERMRIDNAGRVGIGGNSTAATLYLARQLTGSASQNGIWQAGQIQSDVTTRASIFYSGPSTAAASFTLATLAHYDAVQSTFGLGSAVTAQYGFRVDSSLTGATNNYGFYSNIASGTGRWNFYANGTAANVFVGQTSLGGAQGSESLRVTPVASAVNYINAQGNTTGLSPTFAAVGSDTNIGMVLSTKGNGAFNFFTDNYVSRQFQISHTASAVNYLQATGSATGGGVTLSAQGTDTNIGLNLNTKGTGSVFLKPNNGNQIAFVASPSGTSDVNYLQALSTATGNSPNFQALGSDTNIGLDLVSKGTGSLRFFTGGYSALQFQVNHTGSAVNVLVVTGGATGNAPVVSAQGSDTNINLSLTAKGTGLIALNNPATVLAMLEKATVSATAATGTINFDAATQPVLYYTTNASGNWTLNIRASSTQTLDSMMATGQSLTLAFLATNGATAYYQSALTIDGASVTPKWQGGTAPTAGNASSIDAYVLTVIKTGSATFTVLASQTKFA